MKCLICKAEFDDEKRKDDPERYMHYHVCPKCIRDLNQIPTELKDHD